MNFQTADVFSASLTGPRNSKRCSARFWRKDPPWPFAADRLPGFHIRTWYVGPWNITSAGPPGDEILMQEAILAARGGVASITIRRIDGHRCVLPAEHA